MDCIELDREFPLTGAGTRSTNRVHVSDIYNDIEKTLFPRKTTGDLSNPLWAEGGFLFEIALSKALGDKLGARPGEVELDNLVGSPDRYDPDTGILYEYKCSWKSSKTHPSERWTWMTQLKAYCKLLGTCTAELHVLYLNGDYREHFGPKYRVFLFCFTEREIEENFEMLKNHAKSKGWM